uniref:peptidylprolyl isomerase n=1 Tax=Kalanchoe fedtschenkoi TaxID=63787 RepID=A0A7N0TAT0_KALFE
MYWLDIGAAQMSSKAFSPVGSSRRPWDITTSHSSKLQDVFSGQSPRFLSRWKNSTPRIVSEVPTTPAVRRREAVGLGVCLGLVGLLSQERISNAAEACELTVAPSGLAFCDKVLGNGPEAVKGQLIKAHYVGKLENGKVFDSSYSRGKPLTFRVGVGEVIRGWDQGILGGEGIPPMLAGGKRSLKLPPELAYGSRGAGCRGGSCIIPPDSVLLFDVEFIGKA